MTRLPVVLTLLGSATIASAQTTEQPPPPPPGAPTAPTPDAPAVPQSTLAPSASLSAPAPKPVEKKKTEPEAGDFDAGGQARFPSGPDDAGEYASFNWVAFDLKGRYYLLKTVTVNANVPLAVKKPDMPMIAGAPVDPSLFGGGTLNLDARLPIPKNSLPMLKYDVDLGLALTLGYMREGAMLLSEKDFPLFQGDLKPGMGLGLITKIKMSSVVDFALLPTYVYQSGEMESQTALQIPVALQIALGSLLKLNLEAGVYTGDDISLRGSNGGRLPIGASLDIKVGPILLHTGAGVATLLTGPLYPSISDSVYVDLNVKYAK
jgi:hypothetical protein